MEHLYRAGIILLGSIVLTFPNEHGYLYIRITFRNVGVYISSPESPA